jgi:hypothetical protein
MERGAGNVGGVTVFWSHLSADPDKLPGRIFVSYFLAIP